MLRTLPARPTSLPQPLSSFIGRKEEISAVCELFMSGARLVTLTGPGGIGKTRLALAMAGQLEDGFDDGVWFVSLTSIADPRLVVPTIARTLQVGEQPGVPALDLLAEMLRGRDLVLVLDNFEHVIASATEIAHLLATCPECRVLVTSREPLRLSGEREYPVPPLTVPAGADGFEWLGEESGAIQLFVDRARYVAPDFRLTDENTPVVAEICRRLDGMPLALELAAAWIRVLSPDDLLTRLDRPLGVLTGGPRDAPVRQQTVRATLQWSYDLLSDGEQRLFRQLSVFTGGCTLAAVEAVAEDDEALAMLSSLVDKGLIRRVDQSGQDTRYEMLEPVRQFALESLMRHGDEMLQARQRHADYFSTLVTNLNDRLDGPGAPAEFERIKTEHGNLRSALDWFREHDDGESGIRLVGELGIFWHQHSHIVEGQAYATAFLESADGSRRSIVRAKALWSTSWLWLNQGDFETALSMNDESCAIAGECGDPRTLADALVVRGVCHFQLGDVVEAHSDWERSLRLFRELEEPRMLVRVSTQLAKSERALGNLDRSRQILTEAMALARGHDLTMAAGPVLGALGVIAQHSGDFDLAADLYRERLGIYDQLGIPRGIADTVERIACLARHQHQFEASATLLGFSSAFRGRYHTSWIRFTENIDIDAELNAVRSVLSDAQFQAALARGRAMTRKDGIEFALQVAASKRIEPDEALAGLTPRETEVLGLVARQMSNREIAAELFISTRTVERHIENIYRKLDIHSRTEAIDAGRRSLE